GGLVVRVVRCLARRALLHRVAACEASARRRQHRVQDRTRVGVVLVLRDELGAGVERQGALLLLDGQAGGRFLRRRQGGEAQKGERGQRDAREAHESISEGERKDHQRYLCLTAGFTIFSA